jgi:agmatinase
VRTPTRQPFLGAEAGEPTAEADAIVVGLATDGGVSFRPGAVEAPGQIRAFSDSIETYSPRARRDLDDLRIVDVGDVTSRDDIGPVMKEIYGTGRFVVAIGGDHSVTPPAVAEVAARHPALAVIGFDAHLDLREDYPGDHACTYRRIADRDVDCFVFGPRSGARSEWSDVSSVLKYCSPSLDMPDDLRPELVDRPVYVTIDIDVLDPSVAPGTGNPEAGGPSFNDLLEAVEALHGLHIVGCDVVEVSPPLDPSGITLGAAALLVRELILRFA